MDQNSMKKPEEKMVGKAGTQRQWKAPRVEDLSVPDGTKAGIGQPGWDGVFSYS